MKPPSQLALTAVAVLTACALALPAVAAGDGSGGVSAPCTGDTTAAGVPQLPGRDLRMGINPRAAPGRSARRSR